MTIRGHCHCGNIAYDLKTRKRWSDITLRVCRCEFCLRHRPRYWSDPDGSIAVTIRDAGELIRYRFGHGSADFVICRRCGVFCFAVAAIDEGHRVVANVNLMLTGNDRPQEAFLEALDENEEQRNARRAASWMPLASPWPPEGSEIVIEVRS